MLREIKRILVPVKGRSADQEAFRLACKLAHDNKARIYVIYVIEISRNLPVDAEVTSETVIGEEILQNVERIAATERCIVEAVILQARDAGPAVVQEAVDREVGLIVLGMSNRRPLGTFSLGQTIPYILKNAPCPVIVWRENGSGTSGSED